MPAPLEIRKAAPSEAAALSALALHAKAHWGYPPEALEAWSDQLTLSPSDIASKAIYVCVLDGTIAGFHAISASGPRWELDHLWVAPQSMRRGVGRALLTHALDLAFLSGAAEVTVDADPNAEQFYCSCGATRSGELPAPIAGQPDRVRPQLVFHAHAR